ncbi:MAG: hypothetical protein IIA92_15060 [Chloroflexi bacterium]|nr:hypothetical protein [Chloroflexota bacterium]
MPEFILVFGVIAVVLTVTALASGLVERSPLSFPLIFLAVGFLPRSCGIDGWRALYPVETTEVAA